MDARRDVIEEDRQQMSADEPQDKVEHRYRPYIDADGRAQLANVVVLSLDLLGTRAGAAEEAQRYLEVTRDAMTRATRWADGGKSSPTVIRWFSDNAAMADPLDFENEHNLSFGFHLITTGWMQLELAMMGLFGRGGIAVGPFFADDTFLYGPALVAAYETESKQAIYPRVLLHESAAAFALKELERFRGGETEVHRTHLAVDRDGLPFVNYLASIYDEPADLEAMLDNHKFHIQSRLKQHQGDPHVHLKYEWLADYHDRFCRANFSAHHRGDLMIGAVDGPELIQFGEEVLKPDRPPDTGLPF